MKLNSLLPVSYTHLAAQTTAGVILICRPILYEEASTRLENTGVFVLSTDMGRRFFNEAVKLMAAVHKRLARAEPQAERDVYKRQGYYP